MKVVQKHEKKHVPKQSHSSMKPAFQKRSTLNKSTSQSKKKISRPLLNINKLKEILSNTGKPCLPNRKSVSQARPSRTQVSRPSCNSFVNNKPKKTPNIVNSAKSEEQGNFNLSVKSKQELDGKASRRQAFLNEAQQRLEAAQFRILNEKLYTTSGSEALTFFHEEDPDSFAVYHKGYQQQVSKWPLDPLDTIIQSIKKMPLENSKVIADLGCGEAKLSKALGKNRTVHSYDLKALNDSVVECDMAQVPLKDEAVDIVVFCLSLMGTNIRDYLLSASRILKKGGIMKVAEVQSRFENVKDFTSALKRFGFKILTQDVSNNYFLVMDFIKKRNSPKKSQLPEISLKPCVYKKR